MDEFILTKEDVYRDAGEREQLRAEFNKPSFKALLEREKGNVCICCGSTLGIEYHHILPLCLGGDNRLSNIQPVCNSCHKLIHGGRVNKLWRDGNGGRKKSSPPSKYKNVLDKYFNCEIGKRECQKLLGITGGSKLTDKWWYKDYLKERGIKRFRNNIDILNSKDDGQQEREVLGGRNIVGQIVYDDGKVVFLYANTYLATHQEYEQEQLSFM